MRKVHTNSPIVANISTMLYSETLPLKGKTKKREALKSPTTSRNAPVGTVNNGLPGDPFDSMRNLEKLSGKFRKLIQIIASEDMLIYAYELIKSNPGNMTPGANKETLDGIDRN